MTLREWMDKSGNDIIETAKIFNVSIYAVKKWLNGDRRPRSEMQAKIKKLTKGDVSPNDFIK